MTDKQATDASGRAWPCRRAHMFFWIAVIVVLAADLGTKWGAFKYIERHPEKVQPGQTQQQPQDETEIVEVIPGLLGFVTLRNEGAVFGMGQGKRWLFVGATFVALGFLLQLFAKSRSDQRLLHFLLAMSMGGALGNLYDRIVYAHVRDFILITARIPTRFGNLPVWPWVFNIADVALVLGIGILLVGWMFGRFDLQCGCGTVSKDDKECERIDEKSGAVERS